MGAAALGAAGSIGGGLIQSSATDRASQQQREMLDIARNDLAPYRAAGGEATNMLMKRLPDLTAPIQLDQAFLESTPGYQFAKSQGLKATQNSAAARGLGKSGAAVKGATAFATGLADQTFGEQFNRELAQRDATFNKLFGTSQMGANAAGQGGQMAVNTGQSIGQNTIGGGTAISAGIQGAGNAINNGAQNWLGYDYANKLMGRQGGTGGGMYTPRYTYGAPTY